MGPPFRAALLEFRYFLNLMANQITNFANSSSIRSFFISHLTSFR